MVEWQRLAGAVPIWNTLVPKDKPPAIGFLRCRGAQPLNGQVFGIKGLRCRLVLHKHGAQREIDFALQVSIPQTALGSRLLREAATDTSCRDSLPRELDARPQGAAVVPAISLSLLFLLPGRLVCVAARRETHGWAPRQLVLRENEHQFLPLIGMHPLYLTPPRVCKGQLASPGSKEAPEMRGLGY